MAVKDKVVSWFLQNIVMPQIEIIDKPGFVATKLDQNGSAVFYRDVFVPEQLLVDIENKISEKYGEKGKQALYSAGKKFGYSFASISKMTNVKSSTEKQLSDDIYFTVRFVESLYASKATYTTNLQLQKIEFEFENYIVCRKNGKGYLLTEGGIAGIWSYMMQNNDIEAVQLKCQGKKDTKCRVLSCPNKNLPENHFIETNLVTNICDEKYLQFNSITPTQFSSQSLKQFIDGNLLEYKSGNLIYKNDRFFYTESSFLPIIELEIGKLEHGQETLFDVCFDYGKNFSKNLTNENYSKFLTDFFPAFGYGDIQCSEKNGKMHLVSLFYPHTLFLEKAQFSIFRGWVSGILSGLLNKELKLEKYSLDYSQNFLILELDEK